MRLRGPLFLLALGTLAACAPTAPTAPAAPPGPPPGVDGRYRGTARLVTGDRFCPRSGPRVYEVQNGRVELAYQAGGRRRTTLTAEIQSDGRIETGDGEGTIQGQLRNGLLEVTVASRQCEHRWTLRKVEP